MVYRDIADDPIFHDNELFAWWVRLRMLADGAYPEAGTFPRRIGDETIDRLVEAGHLIRVNSERFRDVAIDAERQAQSALGKAGAAARWGAHRPPTAGASGAHQIAMPTETETETETDVESGLRSVNAREPRRRRTEVRGFAGPLGR